MTTTNDGPSGGAEAMELFTVEQLTQISQNQDPVANDLAGDRAALVPEMIKGGIVTKNQITAFLANICQETDWLNTLEEYGDEAYFRWGPADGDGLYLGDEWMYHGRGYIMNTWLDAYQRLSDVLGVDLVSNPDLLAQDKALAAKAAVWYWNMRDCGPVADQEDFVGVCSLINRGENPPQGDIHGWGDRLAAYERAKSVIGTSTEPVTELAIEANETAVEEAWSWPVANDPPIDSDIYQLRHPTRYVWRPDVERWARWLVDKFNVWCNSYYEHPEDRGFEEASTDPDGTVWYIENTSLDVWGPQGRNDPLGSTVGWQIFRILMDDPNPPNIRWIIWQATQYGAWNNWEGEPFGIDPWDPFMQHHDHIHVTYS